MIDILRITWRILIVIVLVVILLRVFWGDIKYLFKNRSQDDLKISYEKGFNLKKEGRYGEAIKVFEKVLKNKPDDWVTAGDIGYCYYNLGNLNQSYRYIKRALEINPESIEDKSLMAIIYAERGTGFSKSLEYLESIESQLKSESELWENSKNVYFLDKSWIYFNNGETKRALEYFEKAVPGYFSGYIDEYEELFSSTHYRIGILYKTNGEFLKAKVSFKKSMKAGGPQSIFAKRSKEELEKLGRVE